ncbi:tail fiber domain-containing protein [Quisquiliibacterium transsilvanicum]|uniref:Peptidase S74 domain-containing protein n=1 Tax=Quisquiliibacterium transsilvanicum TaxID=1549638 RepID=A0A7W8HFZ3_9BURK|nr:tail fiber domain-containing protein [Quisquiliibacterium transsilvanicum]MBB5271321.1 hypothetical protein [Quisquiliibacterium transsilvanicum]
MSRFHSTEFDLLPERAFAGRPGRFGQRLTYEGSKGSSTPAPDPRLVEAQIRSMGVQDDVIQRIVATSEEMMPLQREQMQFGLDAARTAYTQAQADRDYTLARRGVLSGLQDRLTEDARSFNTEDRRDQLAGQATADVSQAFGVAREAQARDLARRGVNPASGAFAAMSTRSMTDEALARAGAANTARTAARQEGFALTDRATNALAGYPSMSMQATGAGAGYGGMGLNLANSGLAGMNAGFGQAAGVAGQMGSNATNMYGAQAQYKLGQDRLAAESDPFASLLGAGAQLGAAWLGKPSDRRLKANIALVGKDERTGLNLYEFAYVGAPQRRFRGVMADEVESRFPAAVVYDDLGFASVDYAMLGIEMAEVQGEPA